jgi:hypothetical protein
MLKALSTLCSIEFNIDMVYGRYKEAEGIRREEHKGVYFVYVVDVV